MRVNGKEIELKRGMTLAEFLAEHNYRAELVAVESNGQIVPRAEFGAAVLKDGSLLKCAWAWPGWAVWART